MPEIAVLLFGIHFDNDYRHFSGNRNMIDFRNSIENYRNNIFDPLIKSNNNLDFFISTYRSEKLHDLLDNYRPKSYTVNRFIQDRTIGRNTNIIKGLNLIKNYEIKETRNKVYDYVLVMRFDVLFKVSLSKTKIKEDFLNIGFFCERANKIDDNFYFFPRIMLNHFEKIYRENITNSAHDFYKLFLFNKIRVNFLFPGNYPVENNPFFKIIRNKKDVKSINKQVSAKEARQPKLLSRIPEFCSDLVTSEDQGVEIEKENNTIFLPSKFDTVFTEIKKELFHENDLPEYRRSKDKEIITNVEPFIFNNKNNENAIILVSSKKNINLSSGNEIIVNVDEENSDSFCKLITAHKNEEVNNVTDDFVFKNDNKIIVVSSLKNKEIHESEPGYLNPNNSGSDFSYDFDFEESEPLIIESHKNNIVFSGKTDEDKTKKTNEKNEIEILKIEKHIYEKIKVDEPIIPKITEFEIIKETPEISFKLKNNLYKKTARTSRLKNKKIN